jgi:Ca-activated chloride channel family protein
MFRFEHPSYLYFLFLIPFLIAGAIFLARQKRRTLQQIAAGEAYRRLIGEKSFVKENVKMGLLISAFTLLIITFANPQIGTRLEEVKLKGIDVMVCLDVSLSMKAEDLKPNRLDLAKREISELIKGLNGNRVGLIVFAGAAYTQFPLTSDYSAADLFLSAADVTSVPEPGTALASALDLATSSFDYSVSTRKVIIVITDGEDHEGDVDAKLKEAKATGIAVYSIGMASPNGAPIPVYDASGRQADFKKDQNGSIILTKLDEQILKHMADETGGKYYLSSPAGDELRAIYADLQKVEKTEFGAKQVTDYDDKYYYFLIPALLLLLIEFFLSDKSSAWFKAMQIKLKLREE